MTAAHERMLAAADLPLNGIRVIDLTAVVLGPMATQQLADLGAEVIKIEPPEGDMMRVNGYGRNPGMYATYLTLNRNKRSVRLDLKREPHRLALRRLIEHADVFVHNMRVQAIERLGFGYDAVRAVNPRIVYCAATGFGQSGPHRDRPAFDDIIQAACGLVDLQARSGGSPEYPPALIADKVAGLATVNAVLAALVRRSRTGAGAQVEVPMLETLTAFTLAEHMGGLLFEGSGVPAGYARLLGGGRRVVRTRDGHMSLLPYTVRHWQSFLEAIGQSELIPMYAYNREALNEHIRALYDTVVAAGPSRTTEDWMALCERLDIPATPVQSVDTLPEHPHLRAVDLFKSAQHPTEGPIRQLRPTTLFDNATLPIRRHAPSLGEHTEEVLREAGIDVALIQSIVQETP